MAAAAIVFILMLAITFSSSAAEAETHAPSSSPPAPTCSEELVMFSPCISYVSAPPNNISDTPDPLCCTVFSTSVRSTAGKCLCYLLRQPMTLGFPLDRSRLLSLSQICAEFNSSDESFESLCSPSVSPELPPLQSIQFTSPFDYGDRDSASPQSLGLPPQTAKISPSSDQFSPDLDTVSPQAIINGSRMISNLLLLTTTIIIMTLATFILTRI
ncbi:Bifunctional inhibitor/lipid-transfer protein/seed storage 2S albumin superfamily protein [Raphanus sativus]|uniref:Non-specific lipid transfer protein GPI-anchored 25-like n=1 Tax=Raphanus sativus TaxID=3726 RepID=A0A9W3C9B7_RAPSA|nr:non-specific lipid transfer protein GPI-anchored 25-like [Raphanus sativus]KAJ4881219.1 Bifunctional inhibitor/lipid-transfer protein/seed storage 2S albumin superfamily protein [Raphanus sativus]